MVKQSKSWGLFLTLFYGVDTLRYVPGASCLKQCSPVVADVKRVLNVYLLALFIGIDLSLRIK